jgi:uncharacterized protein
MTSMTFASRVAVLALAALLSAAGCNPPAAPAPPAAAPGEQPQHLPTVTIHIGDRPLVVEVANTEDQRRTGMMHRAKLGPDEAMLFVFPRVNNLSFWMKNTLVDLDLAYITAEGRVAQTDTMKALDESPIPSRDPVRFALEVPAGWLAAHGVTVGTQVRIPPEAEPPANP